MATAKDSRKSAACKTCGEKGRPSSFPEYRGGDCGACFRKRKEQENRELLAKPCKVCGKEIGSKDKRQVVCSRACAFRNLRKDRIEVKCCNCGKSVFRYPHALKVRSVFSCSLECQRQYALVENHSSGIIDRLGKSAEAKQKWKRASSRDRGNQNRWWVICRAGNIAKRTRSDDPWKRKFRSSLSTLNQRAVVRKEVKWSLKYLAWESVVQSQYLAAIARGKRLAASEWLKKCDSVARNIKHRLSN